MVGGRLRAGGIVVGRWLFGLMGSVAGGVVLVDRMGPKSGRGCGGCSAFPAMRTKQDVSVGRGLRGSERVCGVWGGSGCMFSAWLWGVYK